MVEEETQRGSEDELLRSSEKRKTSTLVWVRSGVGWRSKDRLLFLFERETNPWLSIQWSLDPDYLGARTTRSTEETIQSPDTCLRCTSL